MLSLKQIYVPDFIAEWRPDWIGLMAAPADGLGGLQRTAQATSTSQEVVYPCLKLAMTEP